MKAKLVKNILGIVIIAIVLGSIAISIMALTKIKDLEEQIDKLDDFREAQTILNLNQSDLNNSLLKTDESVIKTMQSILNIFN